MSRFVPYRGPQVVEDQAEGLGEAYFSEMDGRRSVRHFSDRPVPRRLIELAIRTASTAPSGAHMQPWTFVAVSDPKTKRLIREAAEKEEHAFYTQRAPGPWIDALAPLGTDWQKPFLERVPWIVVLFAQRYGVSGNGERVKHYYVPESVGIAAGLFISSLHRMGLSTLTHTPSPMGFLHTLLGRPPNERPFIMFPIGYPADDAVVPDLRRKDLAEVAVWHAAEGPED